MFGVRLSNLQGMGLLAAQALLSLVDCEIAVGQQHRIGLITENGWAGRAHPK